MVGKLHLDPVISTSRLVPAASSCRLEPTVTVTAFGPGRD